MICWIFLRISSPSPALSWISCPWAAACFLLLNGPQTGLCSSCFYCCVPDSSLVLLIYSLLSPYPKVKEGDGEPHHKCRQVVLNFVYNVKAGLYSKTHNNIRVQQRLGEGHLMKVVAPLPGRICLYSKHNFASSRVQGPWQPSMDIHWTPSLLPLCDKKIVSIWNETP